MLFHIRTLRCILAFACMLLPATGHAAQPQRWAILIGVNDYVQLEDLRFASEDAEALARGLAGAGFPEKQIFLVKDGAKETKYLPIKSNIERQLDLVLNLVGKDDLVLVAFSGHGMHLDGKSYLCPTEANVDNPAASMIAVDDVYARLAKCPAAMKLIVLDACRNDPRPAGKKSATPQEDAQKLATSFERPPDGIWLLASCGAGQVSYEDQDLKHGVFMSYLLEGLAGKADGNKNGKISLGELYEFASQETKLHVARKWTDFQVPAQKGELNGVFEFERIGPKSGETVENSIGMELVFIPPGEFDMGSPEREEGRSNGSTELLHTTRITKPFYMGKYEVTQSEYAAIMGSNPSYFHKENSKVTGLNDTSQFPVEKVSFEDAQAFCRAISAKEAKKYRLPTEAEWEYACRAGTKTAFYSGGTEASLAEAAWYRDLRSSDDNRLNRTNRVGQKKPNAFGLHDMHGNVFEWCADWYDKDYYAGSPTNDPQGPSSGEKRVLRGGSWFTSPLTLRAAFRYPYSPTNLSYDMGFRVIRED